MVRVGTHMSSPLTLNTRSPQGCMLSPLLYSLYTHDCVSTSDSNIIITAVVGLISYSKEEAYKTEIIHLESWCRENNLLLNASKTKELIVDFRRNSRATSVGSTLSVKPDSEHLHTGQSSTP